MQKERERVQRLRLENISVRVVCLLPLLEELEEEGDEVFVVFKKGEELEEVVEVLVVFLEGWLGVSVLSTFPP